MAASFNGFELSKVSKSWSLSTVIALSLLVHGLVAALFAAFYPPSLGTELMAPAQKISLQLMPAQQAKPLPTIKPAALVKPKVVKQKKIITKAPSAKAISKKTKKPQSKPVAKPLAKKVTAKAKPQQQQVAQAPVLGKVKQQQSYAPIPSYRPEPKYPMLARRRGIEGTVSFEVFLANSGKVNQAIIMQSSGSRLLDRAAEKTIYSWRFPANRFNSLSSFKQRIIFTLK